MSTGQSLQSDPRTGTPSDYAAASPRPAAHPARDPPRRRASRSASARHRPLPAQWPPRQSPARAGRPARPECPRHILPTLSTWLSPLAYNVVDALGRVDRSIERLAQDELAHHERFRAVYPLRLVVKPLGLGGPQHYLELVGHLFHSNHSALNCCAQI